MGEGPRLLLTLPGSGVEIHTFHCPVANRARKPAVNAATAFQLAPTSTSETISFSLLTDVGTFPSTGSGLPAEGKDLTAAEVNEHPGLARRT